MKSTKDIIKSITKYQQQLYSHPLTCGNDSRHRPLKAIEKDDKVVLICEDCDYEQTYIPDIF